jgi:hypothetical protein
MSPRDPFDDWRDDRAKQRAPEDFADRVMAAIRDRATEHIEATAPYELAAAQRQDVRSRGVTRLQFAAGAFAAMACHVALAFAIWLAWPPLAQ